MQELKSAIESAAESIELEKLTIFTVGSYGRSEASTESDIDLFFVYSHSESIRMRRTNEIRLFGRLIDAVADLGFPELSNDAQYLEAHDTKDVLSQLGSPDDDYKNYFTTRMLLLLESQCLYGKESYDRVIQDILQSYHRDYQDHEDHFRPWFLLNDIMRFWKTLLLNYENKRNAPDSDAAIKQRVKNFKLKFSRATTCFATICAIGALGTTVSTQGIGEIVRSVPRKRLLSVAEAFPVLAPTVDQILDEYAWFLEQTALPTAEIEDLFREDESRERMSMRAQAYGELLFQLVVGIDEQTDNTLLRSLVV